MKKQKKLAAHAPCPDARPATLIAALHAPAGRRLVIASHAKEARRRAGRTEHRAKARTQNGFLLINGCDALSDRPSEPKRRSSITDAMA